MFKASCAVTAKLKELRVVALPGTATAKCVAALLTTLIEPELPVIEGVALSATVMVELATVFSAAGKVPVPFVNPELAGSMAWASLLEKWTRPA